MNPAPERRVIVTWTSPEPKKIVPVAELLVRNTERARYEFGYLEGAGDPEAVAAGFRPFLAFPHLDRRYASADLFPFFANRLLRPTRPDYIEWLAAVGLNVNNASIAELLGRTNGRRATDQIETFLVPVPDATGRYVTHFLVRGVRYLEGAEQSIARLRLGDVLTRVVEENRPPPASQLQAYGRPIGHAPEHLLGDLDRLDRAGANPLVIVLLVNPPPHPAHDRLLCRLEAEWPAGFAPFAEAALRPCISLGAR